MNLRKDMKFADFLTLLNAILGVLAIFTAIHGKFIVSAILIIAAVVFDYFDGKVARIGKTTKIQKLFGKELDSLADIISFGVAPVVLGYMHGLTSTLSIIVLLFYAACGILRLARFNITKIKGYEGVPITICALIIAITSFFVVFNQYFLIMYFILGYLMISTIKIPKLI